MAPVRRARRGRGGGFGEVIRVEYIRQRQGGYVRNLDQTFSGERIRNVMDSYCPYCATDIRALGRRRLVRCPNASLCGKPLPLDENSCPNCTHYVRATDNFCRICRTNLRSVVRGRGGLYQQLNRVPSPLRNNSPPRPQPEENDSDDSNSENGDEDENNGNQPEINNAAGAGQGGFLRVVPIDD